MATAHAQGLANAPSPGALDWLTNPGKAIFEELAHIIGKALSSLVDAVVQYTTKIAQVHFGQRYISLYGLGLHIAIIFGAAAILIAAIAGALTGDLGKIKHGVLRVVLGIMGAFALLTVVLEIQKVIVGLDQAVLSTLHASNGQAGAAALETMLLGSGGIGVGFDIMLGVLLLLGMLILLAILALASALVYVGCFFAPMAFMWSIKAGRRTLEFIAAMLLTPFVVSSVVAVGFAIIGDPSGRGATRVASAITHDVMGTALVFIAIASPLAILKIIPLADGLVADIRSPHQFAAQGAQRVAGLGGAIQGRLHASGKNTANKAEQTSSSSANTAGMQASTEAAGAGAAGEAAGAGAAVASGGVAAGATGGAAAGPVGAAAGAAAGAATSTVTSKAKQATQDAGNAAGGTTAAPPPTTPQAPSAPPPTTSDGKE